jgi:hypothetical protein
MRLESRTFRVTTIALVTIAIAATRRSFFRYGSKLGDSEFGVGSEASRLGTVDITLHVMHHAERMSAVPAISVTQMLPRLNPASL